MGRARSPVRASPARSPARSTRPSPASPRPLARRLERWALVLAGIVALAAALRLWKLGERSLWIDEALTWRHLDGDLGHLLGRMDAEDTAPLYPLLGWGWSRVFGLSEAGLRSLPALLGVATIPVVWAAAARLGGRRAAAIAALLAAVSPFLVWHAQDARAYALLILLSAVAFLAFLHVLAGDRGRWAAVWGASSALAVATHYDAVFPFAVQAVWLLAAGPGRRAVLSAAAVPVAVGLALLPLAAAQSGGRLVGETGVAGDAGLGDGAGGGVVDASGDGTELISFLGVEDVEFLARRAAYIGGQFATGYQPRAQLFTVAASVLLLAVAAAAIVRLVPRERLRPLLVPVGVGVATIAVPVLVALTGVDQVLTRYQSPAFVPLLVALAAAIAFAGRRIALPLVAVAAALAVGVTLATADDPKFGHQDWRGALGAIGSSGEARLLVLSALRGEQLLPVYRPRAARLDGRPPPVREIVVVALPDDRVSGGRRRHPPRPPSPPAPDGFRLAERRLAETFTLLRYRAARPTPPSRPELASLRLLPATHTSLVVVPPGAE